MVIKFEQLIKKTEAYRLLFSQSKFPCHAYLLDAKDRTALRVLTKLFIAECLSSEADNASEMVHHGTCGDVIWFPEKREKILTEDIDGIIDTSYFTPTSFSKKFYIIDFAETMSAPCQNKLLKTLEEPPKNAYFILLSTSKDAMLPTVISRCFVIKLEEFTSTALVEELSKYYPKSEKLELACVAAGGSVERAEKMVASERYSKLLDIAMDTLRCLKKSSEISRYAYNFSLAKDNLVDLVDLLQLIIRDVMVFISGNVDGVLLKSRLSDIIALSKEYGLEFVAKSQEIFQHAKIRISTNGNALSIIDELLFSILEVKSKCQM